VGVLTCLLLARVLTTAVARALRGRRFRDIAAVVFAVGTATLGIAMNAVVGRGATHPDQLDAVFARIGRIAGWTPVGWVWAVPADLATGAYGRAAIRLVLALVLVALLLLAWHRLLGIALTSPSRDVSFGRVRSRGLPTALLPDTPAGAIAGRCLRYWRRDPRYVTTAVTAVIVPVLLLTWQATIGAGSTVILLSPVLLAWLVASALSQDTSFDGSALWLHAVSAVRGTDDRIGRVLAITAWSLPMIVVVDLITLKLVDGWSRAGPVLGLSIAVLLAGAGASSLVSARWQTKAPAAGGNPFTAESGSGLEGVLVVIAHAALTGVAVLPVAALALASVRSPGLGMLVPVLGLLVGVLALLGGIRRGGRLLEASWPDVMSRMTR
jgi:ABC-2 type transport system permease protein